VDLVGTGQRLTSAGLMAAANKVGVDPATLRAVLEVETAGAGFDAKNRIKLLFEPHVFYKQLGPVLSGKRPSGEALHIPRQAPAPIHLFPNDTIRFLKPWRSMRWLHSTRPHGAYPR